MEKNHCELAGSGFVIQITQMIRFLATIIQLTYSHIHFYLLYLASSTEEGLLFLTANVFMLYALLDPSFQDFAILKMHMKYSLISTLSGILHRNVMSVCVRMWFHLYEPSYTNT